MASLFRSKIEADVVEVRLFEKRLLGRSEPLPFSDWSRDFANRRVAEALKVFVENSVAEMDDFGIRLSSEAAASLDHTIAERIGFPPLARLGLAVALEGRIETPDGRLRLRWTDRHGREVRPERTGIVLRWGNETGRLSAHLFRIVCAADRYNQTISRSLDDRISAWLPVQQALRAATGAEVKRDGFLDTFTLYQAGSFALDVEERVEGIDFTPVLMSRTKAPSLEDEAPAEELGGGSSKQHSFVDSVESDRSLADGLLMPDEHRTFLHQFLDGQEPTRDAYVVGRNRYVLIDESLKRALDVVRAKRRSPPDERRAFLRNPRAALADAIDPTEDSPTAALFIETKNYSDRVEGLGLWEKPSLPWLTRQPNSWLPEGGWISNGEHFEPAPLTSDELAQIERDIESAEVRGDAHVVIRGVPIPIDSAPRVLDEERRRTDSAIGSPSESGDPTPSAEKDSNRLVLVIKKTNFEGIDYQLSLTPRPVFINKCAPLERMGSTPLKAHQHEGFRWLIAAWSTGWPGVLLADDMGLGKTFQALTFLAWIKTNAAAARSRHRDISNDPMLVVAPTALLKNWEKECADRLSSIGLGVRIAAYGNSLRELKLDVGHRSDPAETLDVSRIREADWILTTYETLTDHERSFARIPYSIVIFDEMQKVKAPDTLNTKAAKTLNADFVLGLTGTPIENRMEDLWCLFDRIAPGYLGDLKSFSKTYREDNDVRLKELKHNLDSPIRVDSALVPPIMKRRMKADILEGLPSKVERKYPTPMPDKQAHAYRDLIAEAVRGTNRSRGHMLSVLHAMRGISLHPDDAAQIDVSSVSRFETFVSSSARLLQTVSILHEVARKGEKALIFIENLAMQDTVSSGLAALFDLTRRPPIINGSMPGEKRLAVVDAFEQSAPGFGVLILSPKAAGVGLNITAANHVIHLSRWWNPAVEDQCNDRAYRIGQTKPVTIHLPIATHPDFPNQSFDEELDRLLERKRRLSRDMLAPPTADGDVETLFEGAVHRR